uniref:Uncharacterized protein n=1 Tax=Calcidiscus leptoporus TaxID=127549 RepID=A0A7S0JEQ2_9EUKA
MHKGYISLWRRPSEAEARAVSVVAQVAGKELVREVRLTAHKEVRKLMHQSRALVDHSADGNITKMREALCAYANPDSARDGKSAMEAAVANGQVAAAECLLDFKASVRPSRLGNPALLRSALEIKDAKAKLDLLELLIGAGASVTDVEAEEAHATECGVEGHRKWIGIAAVGNKLFCAPCNASSVLVIDAHTNAMRTIECGVEGTDKWMSIAAVGSKLFCAPYNSLSVLVIDAETEAVQTIECGIQGKWHGIAAVGSKLFCAPNKSQHVLVIDAEAEVVRTIDCGVDGDDQWHGIAAVGTKLFCCPRSASVVLVIDAESEAVRTIECGVEGKKKWYGIAAAGSKLFCAPSSASCVLVIDAETEAVRTIECGIDGVDKWNSIVAVENTLFCAPRMASSILVIDAEQESVRTIECGVEGGAKWNGVAAANGKLFFAPFNASSVLVLDTDCSSRADELTSALQKQAEQRSVFTGSVDRVFPGRRLKTSFAKCLPSMVLAVANDPCRITFANAAALAAGQQAPLTLSSHPGLAVVKRNEKVEKKKEWKWIWLAIGPASRAISCCMRDGELFDPEGGVVSTDGMNLKVGSATHLLWNTVGPALLQEAVQKKHPQLLKFRISPEGAAVSVASGLCLAADF